MTLTGLARAKDAQPVGKLLRADWLLLRREVALVGPNGLAAPCHPRPQKLNQGAFKTSALSRLLDAPAQAGVNETELQSKLNVDPCMLSNAGPRFFKAFIHHNCQTF